MGLKENLKSLDLLAQPVMLNFEKGSNMKTIFGALMTITYIGTVLAYSATTIAKHFDLSTPSVLQLSIDSGDYPRIDLLKKGIIPVLLALDPHLSVLNPNEMKRYITPVFIKRKVNTTIGNNGVYASEVDSLYMDIVPCSSLFHDTPYPPVYRDILNTSKLGAMVQAFGLCIDIKESEAYVKGGGTDLELEYFSLEIFPCSLASGCATQEELAKVTIVIGYPVYSANYSNHQNPLLSILSYDNVYMLTTDVKQRYSARLAVNQMFDDRGIFYGKTLKAEFLSVDKVTISSVERDGTNRTCTPESIVSKLCTSYLAFEITSSGRSNTMVRRYTNLNQVVSEIGGINSVLYFFFWIVTGIYLKIFRYQMIATALLPSLANQIKQSKEKLKCKFSKCDVESEKKKIKVLQEAACSFIRKQLDVIEIMKELSHLKLIVKLLLSEKQKRVTTLAFISLEENNPQNNILKDAVINTPEIKEFLETPSVSEKEEHRTSEINQDFGTKTQEFLMAWLATKPPYDADDYLFSSSNRNLNFVENLESPIAPARNQLGTFKVVPKKLKPPSVSTNTNLIKASIPRKLILNTEHNFEIDFVEAT